MSSDTELFVTETLRDDYGAEIVHNILADVGFNQEAEFDHLGSNLTEYKSDWPEHVQIPIESVEDGIPLGTIHSKLTFKVENSIRGRYIEEQIEEVWLEFDWENISKVSSTEDASFPPTDVIEYYDIEDNTAHLT